MGQKATSFRTECDHPGAGEGEMEIAPRCLLHCQLVLALTYVKAGYPAWQAQEKMNSVPPSLANPGDHLINLIQAVSDPSGVGSSIAW